MSLVLQEISVQVKYWSHANLTKKQVKNVLLIKARQNPFYRELLLKLDRSSTQAASVENYEIRFSRSNYMHILEYLCRVSFLTTLNIYNDYFKSRYKWCKGIENIIHAYCDRRQKFALVPHIFYRSYCVFTPRVLWPRSFLIFTVDKLKNFAANIFLKLVC